ncbi:MAG TPA: MerR family transcriptional regulator [Spirochaetota bacterium]|nr:MerR family transcriptional regulator [Spirochaetota bacterium]HQJ93094.1 MerR family transcriptional regulator [Clostridia bacterium]
MEDKEYEEIFSEDIPEDIKELWTKEEMEESLEHLKKRLEEERLEKIEYPWKTSFSCPLNVKIVQEPDNEIKLVIEGNIGKTIKPLLDCGAKFKTENGEGRTYFLQITQYMGIELTADDIEDVEKLSYDEENLKSIVTRYTMENIINILSEQGYDVTPRIIRNYIDHKLLPQPQKRRIGRSNFDFFPKYTINKIKEIRRLQKEKHTLRAIKKIITRDK